MPVNMERKRRIGIGVDICSHNSFRHYTSIAISDTGLTDIEILCAGEENGKNIAEEIIALVEDCLDCYYPDDAIFTVSFNSDNSKKNEKLTNSILSLLIHKLGFKYENSNNSIISEGKKTIMETNVVTLFEKTGNGFVQHLTEDMLTIPKPAEYDAGILSIAAIYSQLGELEPLKSALRLRKLEALSQELMQRKCLTENIPDSIKFLATNNSLGEMLFLLN